MRVLGNRWRESDVAVSCLCVLVGFLLTAGSIAGWGLVALVGQQLVTPSRATLQQAPRIGGRDTAGRSTVRISADTCGGSIEGLGVSVNGWILTTRHLVEDASTIVVSTPDGHDLDVVSVEVSPSFDLAAIRVGDPIETPAALDSARAHMGEPLTVVRGLAFGLETERTAIGGETRGTGGNDPPLVQHLVTHAVPGDSGGGVFAEDGHLVGIVYAQRFADRAALVLPIDQVVGEFGRLVPLDRRGC